METPEIPNESRHRRVGRASGAESRRLFPAGVTAVEKRVVVHLIEGREGYGVASVLRRIGRGFPFVHFMALEPGAIIETLPSHQVLWVGSEGLSFCAGRSTGRALFGALANAPKWWRIAGKVAEAMPSRPILFHCHSQYTVLIAALAKLRRGGPSVKILFHFHSTMNRRRLCGVLSVVQRRFFGEVVDGLVAVSRAVSDYWRPLACPIWVVYNGVEAHPRPSAPPCYRRRDGARDVLIAGSLSREKGHLVAVEALGLLGPRAREFHLWIAGGPLDEAANPFAGELRRRVEALGLSERVTFLGFVDPLRDLVPFMWAGLQQRITPEPGSVWVLEAMSAGLPLIASATGGTPEAVRHEREGLLVPANDPRAVADALLRLADDEALRAALSANAAARAKEFSVEAFVENLRAVYAGFGALAPRPDALEDGARA